MMFSYNKKLRDRWLLVLVQQLEVEAVGAEIFMIFLSFFHGCKIMAVAAFLAFVSTF